MGQYFEVTNAGLVKFKQKGTEQLVLEQGVSIPVDGLTGQIFWKTDTQSLRVHDGASFRSVGAWIDNGTTLTLPSPGRQVQFSDGSAANPSISFQAQINKGLFHAGTDILGVAINGAEVARFDASGNFQISNGGNLIVSSASGTYPRLSSSAGELNLLTQGFTRLTVGYNGGMTLATGQVLVPNGSVGAPTYSYGGETTTGHYRDATYLNSVSAGVTLLRVGSSHVETINGTAANPAYSYINSQNAGQFLVSANIIAWSTASTEAMRIDASQNITLSGSTLSLIKSVSGGNVLISVQNSSNTTSSYAIHQLIVAGTLAGDPYTQYTVTGGSTWLIGIDNSDSDKFKISASSALGTNDYLVIDPATGIVTMPNTTFVANKVLAIDGTLGAPSIAFASQTASGSFYSGSVTGEWTMVCNGNRAIKIHPNLVAFYSGGTERINVSSAGHLIPVADNTYKCGDSGARWSELRATNVYTGDIHLENGWTITEGDKVGRDKDEIILLSPAGKKYKFLVAEVV